MSGILWMELAALAVSVLLVGAVVGLIRICLEVEQVASEDRATERDQKAPERRLNPWSSAS